MGKKSISGVDLISTAEAAALLGKTESAVKGYAQSGLLPGRKLGLRAWVFRRADVEAVRGRLPGRGRPRKAPA